ncbi:hypothetical protein FG479_19410 [Burkholderia pseudomallei]|nr:hypothetical protein [Burkholderia pseudomallei]
MKFTDYLAVYASILSTLVFVWNIFQSRPRIRVDLVVGMENADGAVKSGLYVIVRNLSSHDVHLSAISVLYPYEEIDLKGRVRHLLRFRRWPCRVGWVHTSLSNYSIDDGCPTCLEARKSHKVMIPESTLDQILSDATDSSLIASVQDQLWNNVYSRRFRWGFSRST